MKTSKNILWGIILIVIGVLVALKALNIILFNIFFDGWWTLFIIIPCIVGLFSERDKTGNLIGILIGGTLLLCCQNVLSFGTVWKLLIPATIVIIGIKMIFSGLFGDKIAKKIESIETDKINYRTSCATFSGNDMIINGESFEGAELTAVFGGIKCDLRNAIIEKDCIIKTSAIFGGIDILVSDKVNVQTNSTSVFGAMSNKTPARKDVPTVYISGVCMFGGVDIK